MTEMRARLVVDAEASAIVGMSQRAVGGLDSMSKAADKTAASFQKVTIQSAEAERMQQRLNSTFNNFGVGSKSARESAVAIQQAQRAQAAYRALEEQIDPLIRAERELAEAQKIVNRAVAAGVVSNDAAARNMQAMQARYDGLVAAQGRVKKSAQGMRGGVQNASYQIADAAVQLQAGTAASIVFAQQMPQLLGGMGMMGAVMGAVVAVGAPLVTMLLSGEEAAGSLDERLNKLDGTLSSVTNRLKILSDQDLSLTFGNMTGNVRGLTETLLDLDRAAELKNLQAALDGVFSEKIAPDFWQKSFAGFAGMSPQAMTAGPDYNGLLDAISQKNYGKLTGGVGPKYDEFERRRNAIMELAKSGEVEQVTAKVRELVDAFAGDGAVTDLNSDLTEMLKTLGDLAINTAKVEAHFNGTAEAAKITAETTNLIRDYRQQAELAEAIAAHGENSAEVEAIRNRHVRDGVILRLREAGVTEGHVKEQETLLALERAQAAEAQVRGAARAKSISDTLTGLSDELAIAQAVATHGEQSVEAERLRADQAREVLRLKLAELNATDEQIVRAEELLEAQRAATREAKSAEAEKKAGDSLADMRRQAELNEAILQFGKDSLTVKRMQIEAARTEYVQSLATLQVAQATKDALLAQWDATNGINSADPFGVRSASQEILRAQEKSVAKLRLEQALIGQNETTKRRVLALYQAELEIRQKGIAVEGELANAIRNGALAESDLAAEVERQASAWGEVQNSAESAIDGILDALLDADFGNAFETLATELQTLVTDLAIKNPIKNAILGTDNPTLDDAGGLRGIWDRFTGKSPALDPAAAAARAAAQSVSSMSVTAANVMIGGAGISQMIGAAANDNLSLGGARSGGITLSTKDISDLKKTVATEWVQSAGEDQARGIVDTIMNRLASGKWGNSVADVVNARSQFSDINGPVAWKSGRNSVDDLPASIVNSRVDQIVEQWLKQRAGGAASIVGDHLNYANPNYSDASNMGWISRLGGPMLGRGSAVHQHGTTSDLQSWRPGDFQINLPDMFAETQTALGQFSQSIFQTGADLGGLGGDFGAFGQMIVKILGGLGGGGLSLGGGSGGGFLNTVLGAFGVPGFEIGGPTGGSNPKRVAGIVHEKEFVFDAAATARIGVANLEALRRGKLRGYERGGYVGAASYPFLNTSSATANADTRPMIQIVNGSSAPVTGEVQEETGPRGQRQYKLTLSDAVATGLTAKGGSARRAMGQMGVRQQGIRRG